jgi:hypothetical protein
MVLAREYGASSVAPGLARYFGVPLWAMKEALESAVSTSGGEAELERLFRALRRR